MERFTGLLGMVVVMAVAYLFSSNRRAIQPRVIFWGLGLQIGFAFLVLKTPMAECVPVAQQSHQSRAGLFD